MSGAEPTRTVSDSRVMLAQHMGISDSNLAGAVHGGTIMKLVDTAGGLAATKFSGSPVVTAAIDELSFLEPVNLGDLVTVTASVNGVGDTSMEVGVKVETENVLTGEVRHTSTAYLLYVALDPETRQPVRVPRLETQTPEERRRQRQARARRKARIARREASLAARAGADEAARLRQEAKEARRQARMAAKKREAEAKAGGVPGSVDSSADESPSSTSATAMPASETVDDIRRWRPKARDSEPVLVGASDSSEPATDLSKWRRRSQ
ncbi:MAG TPA: acyl-CoA thioesterase [Actinomycetota bacterium]|nr:acyl-CoA thioesterase [Actinomycetota bacterium]